MKSFLTVLMAFYCLALTLTFAHGSQLVTDDPKCADIMCLPEMYCSNGSCICRTNFTCGASCNVVTCASDAYCLNGACKAKKELSNDTSLNNVGVLFLVTLTTICTVLVL
ncbi:predicted protein [Naegleria gruberi]|uniref:Predicted protein n=1 Tax=Naegleria gruberi TaxID=5762 RepID=D2VST6_NAEGR|nr:uncharacterized protein NAEGRDRAFT_72055 [Naegleria gruberi]EFC40252.1 predicted protein [Naegleria gruberi]|eukprot:XP_002672996.1 predicted protein [Naegleria gruberi strain NEG-M]